MAPTKTVPDKVHMVVERRGACSSCQPCRSCKTSESKCSYDEKKVSYVGQAYVDWEAAYKDAFASQVAWIERTVRKGKGMHLVEAKRSILRMDLDVCEKLELLHDEIEDMDDVIPMTYNVLDLPIVKPKAKAKRHGRAQSDEDEDEEEEDDFDEDVVELRCSTEEGCSDEEEEEATEI